MERKRWTQQEEETLIHLYEDPKVFPKDIAKMLGRTLPQVYNKARAMGLKAPMERIRMAGTYIATPLWNMSKIHSFSPNTLGLTKSIQRTKFNF